MFLKFCSNVNIIAIGGKVTHNLVLPRMQKMVSTNISEFEDSTKSFLSLPAMITTSYDRILTLIIRGLFLVKLIKSTDICTEAAVSSSARLTRVVFM